MATHQMGFPGGSVVKNLPAHAGDVGLIPGLGRFPGEGNSNPLQYSCLGNPMDRGAWQATILGVTKESDMTQQQTTHQISITARNRTESESENCSVVSDSLETPQAIQSMEFSRPEYWSVQPFPYPGDLPNPGIEPRSPALQVDSLPAEPQGKPKNTGAGSLSLLQQIFLIQESNWGFLNCRQILYQLSYQGSPNRTLVTFKLHTY